MRATETLINDDFLYAYLALRHQGLIVTWLIVTTYAQGLWSWHLGNDMKKAFPQINILKMDIDFSGRLIMAWRPYCLCGCLSGNAAGHSCWMTQCSITCPLCLHPLLSTIYKTISTLMVSFIIWSQVEWFYTHKCSCDIIAMTYNFWI